VIRHLATAVSASPRLRRVVVRMLDRLPRIKSRLKAALTRHANAGTSSPPHLDESLLSADARRVLDDLLRARERIARESAHARTPS
jgi:phage shock protein A